MYRGATDATNMHQTGFREQTYAPAYYGAHQVHPSQQEAYDAQYNQYGQFVATPQPGYSEVAHQYYAENQYTDGTFYAQSPYPGYHAGDASHPYELAQQYEPQPPYNTVG
jgi:hypothetical protein